MAQKTFRTILPLFLACIFLLSGSVQAQSVNARNLLKLARSYASQDDWARAKDYAQKALQEEAGYLDALYMRAFAHRELEEFSKAEADFNEVIRVDPNYLPTYGALADMYLKQKEYDKADKVFARLSKVPQGATWSSYYRGVVSYLKQDLPKAEQYWREVLNQDSNFAPAHHNLGALYLAEGNHLKALANFKEALEKKPEMPMYRFHVAWAQDKAGQTEAAQTMLKKIMNENGDNVKVSNLARGLDRLIRKTPEPASLVLKTVTEDSPENLDGWVLLGRAYLALNKTEEARAALEKAKELDGAFKEVDELLAKLPVPKVEESKVENNETIEDGFRVPDIEKLKTKEAITQPPSKPIQNLVVKPIP